jgi:hypothetical protein
MAVAQQQTNFLGPIYPFSQSLVKLRGNDMTLPSFVIFIPTKYDENPTKALSQTHDHQPIGPIVPTASMHAKISERVRFRQTITLIWRA